MQPSISSTSHPHVSAAVITSSDATITTGASYSLTCSYNNPSDLNLAAAPTVTWFRGTFYICIFKSFGLEAFIVRGQKVCKELSMDSIVHFLGKEGLNSCNIFVGLI